MKTTLIITIYFSLIFSALQAQKAERQLLSVGDPAPPLKVFKWVMGTPVNELSKDRVYVVEFGATWCAPCAAAIPKLSALAEKYKDDLTVTSFFVMEKNVGPNKDKLDYINTVENYVRKRADKIKYSVAVDGLDKEMEIAWLRASGNISVPQSFVIDRNGKIAYIGTNFTDLTSVIESVLSKEYKDAQPRENIVSNESSRPFDYKKLLLIDGNGGDSEDFDFRSIIQKYNGKIESGNPEYINSFRFFDFEDSDKYLFDRIQLVGVGLSNLYYLAYADTLSNQVFGRNHLWEYPDTVKYPNLKRSYGTYWHLPVIEVSDISPFNVSKKTVDNRYNYSLKVPTGLGTAKFLQQTMQRDLMTYFGFEAVVEVRQMPYWKLIRSGSKTTQQALKSKNPHLPFEMLATEDPYYFKQAPMTDLIWMLGSCYGYGKYDYGKLPWHEQGAFVDETGIDYLVDFKYDVRWTFDEFKKYLNSVGLDVIKDTRPMKVVVIRDAKL